MKPGSDEVQLTAGVDLSTDPAKTGACIVEWRGSAAVVRTLKLGVDDDEIVCMGSDCAKVGIDAPFGWPQEFVKAIHAYATQPVWPSFSPTWLSRRETDRRVQALTKLTPLAVAADRIGATAMRCAGILARLGIGDKSGAGRVCEVYPAAALKVWGLASRGYKRTSSDQGPATLLAKNVSSLLSALPTLTVREDQQALLRFSDDAFDSLVAAIVARAVADCMAVPPSDEAQWRLAREEGWIWIPNSDVLERLAGSHMESKPNPRPG